MVDRVKERQAKSWMERKPGHAIGLISTLHHRAGGIFPVGGGRGLVTMVAMPPKNAARQRRKSPPPGETGQEGLYLHFLSEKQIPVTVKLRDGEAVYGWIEYFDDRMIRLTREGKPNLFIYKNQIRTIAESFRSIEARRRERQRGSATKDVHAESLGNGTHASLKQELLAPALTADTEFDGAIPPPAGAHQSSKEPAGA
jgi:host factor-I protein